MRGEAVSHFDVSDAEGVDLGGWESDAETAVEELCVHGEHPIECSLCTSVGTISAVSGEEEHVNMELGEDQAVIEQWIARATAVELKAATYAIEREVTRRKEVAKAELKALDTFDKPVRRTRKDAGMKREEYKATKGAA